VAKRSAWSGGRNYTAAIYAHDKDAHIGDGVFFYHSSCPRSPASAGIAEVASAPSPTSQFARRARYYDSGAKTSRACAGSMWRVRALRKTRLVPLAELRKQKPLGENDPCYARQPAVCSRGEPRRVEVHTDRLI